jgi:thiamine-monophosphate kinase
MSDLTSLGEAGIIDLFSKGKIHKPVIKGIGDDCAVVGRVEDALLLLTTDLLLEGVHFDRRYCQPEKLGSKSLSVNLSDIAAMGGEPLACLLAVSLPSRTRQSRLTAFRDGFMQTAARYDCQIIGGDTCGSASKTSIAVTVLGRVGDREIMWRTGAREGDDVWVSGTPGLSALGLFILRSGMKKLQPSFAEAVEKHLNPEPRLALGRMLARESLVTSCIDTSDGIAVDLGHICELNGLGAVIEESALPQMEVPRGLTKEHLHWALNGGEDYELLFTAAPADRVRITKIGGLSRIGRMVSRVEGFVLLRKDGGREKIEAKGFSHF